MERVLILKDFTPMSSNTVVQEWPTREGEQIPSAR